MHHVSQKLKEPILVSVYRVAGVLSFIAGFIAAVNALTNEAFGGVFLAILGGVGACVICFGIAQVIGLIATMTANTSQLCSQLEDLSTFARTRMATATPTRSAPSIPDPLGIYSSKQGRFYYSESGDQKGPFTVQQMKQLFEDSQTTIDTPVFREGAADWAMFASFIELNV